MHQFGELNPETNHDANKFSYPQLDWLRFVLASIVVLGHSDFQFPAFLTGNLAVQVFFALSGWLIGGILLKTNRHDLPRFFFNRATRIWIPYALAMVILYTLAALKEGIDFFWVKYFILDITFTHQLFTFFPAAANEMPLDGSGNQFWSISVEEQFYLIAPLLLIFVASTKKLWVWVLLFIATATIGPNFASISAGVCAAIAAHRYEHKVSNTARAAAFVVAIICTLLLIYTDFDRYIAPIFSISVVLSLTSPGRRTKAAIIAGGLSYPLYLNHYLGVFSVNFFAKQVMPLSHAVSVLFEYTVSVALGLGLYWFVDRQILIHRNQWYSTKLGTALGATAYILVGTGIVAGLLMDIYGPHG